MLPIDTSTPQLSMLVRGKRIGRREDFALQVGGNGVAFWFCIGHPQVSPEGFGWFHWMDAQSATRLIEDGDREAIWKCVETLRADADSECALALNFAAWSEEERVEWLLEPRDCTFDEFKRVVAIRLAREECWQQHDVLVLERDSLPEDDATEFCYLRDETDCYADQSETFHLDVNRILAHFGGNSCREKSQLMMTQMMCLEHVPHYEIRFERPSFHELIDAHISWAHWQTNLL